MKVLNGIDNIDNYDSLFKGKKLGLITNPTGIDRDFRSTIDILNSRYELKALYGPEHGVRGDASDGASVSSFQDKITGINTFSLYRPGSRRFSDEMLEGIDAVVYDIQDVGMRYYTYIYTMLNCLEDCAKRGIEFIVLDRIDPLGDTVEGNILEESCLSFVGGYSLTTRYGLTPGEFAMMANKEKKLGANLSVVPCKNWDRNSFYCDTDLPFINPSPNIPTFESILAYAGTCFFEGTNCSEGRGTTRPFEMIGAPYIEPNRLADEMNRKNLPGVWFRPCYITPTFSKHQGQQCGAVQLHILNKTDFQPLTTGVTLLYTIRELFEGFEFRLPSDPNANAGIDLLSGSREIRQGVELDTLLQHYKHDSALFRERKREYQLY